MKSEKLKAEILEKKRLALAAQTLMKETVARVLEKEGENGLLITKAYYGKLDENSSSSNLDESKQINVRIPLQFLVQDHSLQILGENTKSNLEGFYDPCIGETKRLYVEYRFNGEEYKAEFEDNSPVRLPKSTHKLSWWSRPFSSVKTN